MFYRYEHYMSISHMVLIVNMVHSSCIRPENEFREPVEFQSVFAIWPMAVKVNMSH